ncbi:hypothetical protein N9I50_00895, partial [bacterium]|nr:hypothetical protein [bacterium]
ALVIALAVLLAVSLSAVAALVVNRANSQQIGAEDPTTIQVDVTSSQNPDEEQTAGEEIDLTSTDNQTAEAATEAQTEEAPAAIEAPTEEVPTEEVAEGTIGVGDLPAAFVTACGSLEVARDVVGSVFDSIAVGPNVRGEHPSSRLMFRYR